MGILEADHIVALVRTMERNHEVIANNLANVDTPQYRTARLRFKTALQDLMDEDGRFRNPGEIDTELVRPLFEADRHGNDVSLDRELVELTKNTLRLKLHLAALSGKIKRMRSAISGR
jgi:flagellar basal-body rod protein FlgB